MKEEPQTETWFKRLTQIGFPRRFPIIQFPNLPLIIAIAAGELSHFTPGSVHDYAAAVSYVAMAIWAYEELVHGVNWVRFLLGLAYLIVLGIRLTHALN